MITWIHEFYGTGKQDIFQGRMVQTDILCDMQFSSLILKFRNLSYVSQQEIALPYIHVRKEKSLKPKFELVNAHR